MNLSKPLDPCLPRLVLAGPWEGSTILQMHTKTQAGLRLAGNEGMDMKMETTIMGYIGTTIPEP